ncbi:uncharacterized protein K02A2.6-like [Corticium candelabrum]|uniref:uncharacterized protein K02A2.6-like n=1 Tax=Corticium candelabrum TaxID=121492 RepID=UPI002E257E52|nr:uncharacterized protein K02A2.6-like [Corticium candelabrum]
MTEPLNFVVETDHKPLVSIMNVQDVSQCPPRLQRLKLRLAPFSFRVEYVSGRAIPVADALSRAPIGRGNNDLVDDIEAYINIVRVAGLPVFDVILGEFRAATQEDQQLSVVLSYLQSSWPKERHNVRQKARPFGDIRHTLSCVDGIILRGEQIVVPSALRRAIIERVHEGHLGVVKTKSTFREHMWPGMAKDLEDAVLRCDSCARFRHRQRWEPLQSTPMPKRPWQQVGSDLFEMDGEHYILIVDYYSRFPELRPLSNLRADDVIAACPKIFACHGIPELFVSDNGPQYANILFRKFASQCGFEHATSSPQYPQGNGLAERTVQPINGLLQNLSTLAVIFSWPYWRIAPLLTRPLEFYQLIC